MESERTAMASFIKFTEVDLKDGRKTRVWAVMTLDGCHCLGRISWYAPWRKYSLATDECPHAHGKRRFEEVCLRDIADFCQKQTGIQRSLVKYIRKSKPITETEEVAS